MYSKINLLQSGGIEIKGLNANAISKRKPLGDPVIEKFMFVPYVIETVIIHH